ncbi:MAG TPA: glycosyltransferase family A protein [Candidatus Limnocylindrales bacterium]|nr:glycosyltransferase family A protein [Candidatus Limnocylindrales bacterium]
MLTIFSMPKAFRGHIGVIQRNAIRSWTRLSPRPEIILFGSDEGTREAAEEFGTRHVPDVAVNEYGTPLLGDIFRQAEARANAEIVCYVNADIIVLSDALRAIDRVRARLQRFLLISERIDLDITEALAFNPGWEAALSELRKRDGVPVGYTGIDIFVFPKGTYPRVPDFALGRLWFDQWLIKAALESGIPVVDLSRVSPVIHQNHDYGHVPGGKEWVWKGKEQKHNLELYGSPPHSHTFLSVTHELTRGGGIRRVRLRKKLFKTKEFVWEVFVKRTARLRSALGFNRKHWQTGPTQSN